MEGRRPVDEYLKFKADFVIDYSSSLLRSLVKEKMSFKYFNRDIMKYYNHFILSCNSYDDIFESFDEEMFLSDRLELINVSNRKLRQIYTIFFKERLLDDLLIQDVNAREIYRLITTTIFIALELDKYITPIAEDKVNYRKCINKIISNNKDLIDKKIVIALKEKQVRLKSTFDNAIIKNHKFITKYNSTEAFEVGYMPIKSCINDQSTNMSVSTLKFFIRELDDKKEKDVKKVIESNVMKNTFTNVEVQLVTYDMFMDLICNKLKYKFITIPEGYFNYKVNLKRVLDLCSGIEKYIVLNIEYHDFLNYLDTIDTLLDKKISIAVRIGKGKLETKKFTDRVKYVFLDDLSYLDQRTKDSLDVVSIKTVFYNTDSNELAKIKERQIDYYV